MCLSFLENRGDPGFGKERASRIVDGDKIGLGANNGERVFDTVGTLGSSGNDVDVAERKVGAECLFEPIKIVIGDTKDRLNDVVAVLKKVDAAQPDGAAFQFCERLFASLVNETATFTGGG